MKLQVHKPTSSAITTKGMIFMIDVDLDFGSRCLSCDRVNHDPYCDECVVLLDEAAGWKQTQQDREVAELHAELDVVEDDIMRPWPVAFRDVLLTRKERILSRLLEIRNQPTKEKE